MTQTDTDHEEHQEISGQNPQAGHEAEPEELSQDEPQVIEFTEDPEDGQPVRFTEANGQHGPEYASETQDDTDHDTTDQAGPDGYADESGETAPETPPEPTSETISFHIHRTIASGRTVITVLTGTTDPYHRTETSLARPEDALPMLPGIFLEAQAHWEHTPRYPASEKHAKPASGQRQTPPANSRNREQQPDSSKVRQLDSQQASLF